MIELWIFGWNTEVRFNIEGKNELKSSTDRNILWQGCSDRLKRNTLQWNNRRDGNNT